MISAQIILDSIAPSGQRLTTLRLRELLSYDKETGIFTWLKVNKRPDLIGTKAGRINTKGHVQITIDGTAYLASHLAYFFMTGEWPTMIVDHANGDKLDNSWENLREATNGQNRANSKTSAESGYKGVYQNGRRWKATIRYNKRLIYLGTFDTKDEVAAAYKEAAKQYHGEFARSNQP